MGSPRLALALVGLKIFEVCWLIQPLQEMHTALGSAEAVPGLVRIVMRHVRRKKNCQILLNGENASDLIIELVLQGTRFGSVLRLTAPAVHCTRLVRPMTEWISNGGKS